MIKLSTGLTSIPISSVPGSEDVEINYMEAEDAEASNSGGFNQLDTSSFLKDLEVEKDMDKKAYLRKKADGDTGQSLKSGDFITGDSAKSEYLATIFSDIVSDLYLSMTGFASHSGLKLDIHMPRFLIESRYDDKFNPDDWTLKFFRFVALNADFESGPGKSNHPERVPNIVKGWRALYLAGEQTGDAYENAMQDAFDYGSFSFLNLDDDMFHSLAGIANAMVRFKELKQEYNSVRVSGVQNSSANSSQPRGSVVQMEFLDFPPGTELKDIGGTNSYKILSASELILKKDDGSSMTINSSNAAKNGVDWSLLVQNLSDDTKTMVSDMVVEGSYKKDFNISKVSKNMREELIKLNSELNGLGYRNLVKVANSAEPDTTDGGSERTVAMPSVKKEPVKIVKTWPEYIASAGGNQDLRNKYNKIRILWQQYAGSNPDQEEHIDRMSFETYKEWWRENYGTRKGSGGPLKVIQDLEMEVSKLANSRDGADATASYKKDFNISKVSKNMREELIKLNSALNGLGYRNLVKFGGSINPDTTFKDLEVDKYYFYPNKEEIIYIDEKYDNGFKVTRWNGRYLPPDSLLNKDFEGFEEDKLFIKIKTYNLTRLFSSESYTKAIDEYQKLKVSHAGTQSAAGASGSAPRPTASTAATKKRSSAVNDWDSYAGSFKNPLEAREIQALWTAVYPDESDFSSYKKWWIENFKENGGGHYDEVIKLLQTEKRKRETTSDPVAAAAAATGSVATTPSAMSVTETVNGKPSVSIGTRGGDQIYLVLESVDRGIPLLYRKDNRTGQIKEMTSNEVIQFRNSLNNREIRRLEDAISRATKSPERAEAFRRYMKSQRRDNRFGRIGERRREEKMQTQSERMKSNPSDDGVKSARQSRLDTLRKKGVI